MKRALKEELLWLLDQLSVTLTRDRYGQPMVDWLGETHTRDIRDRTERARGALKNEPEEDETRA